MALPAAFIASVQAAEVVIGGGDNEKTITIPKLTEAARIDGVMDDATWRNALLIEDFHQYEPVEYAQPSQRTQVWVYYTEDSLYIASFFEEADMSKVSANILRQGQGLNSDDILAVVLDPYLDRRNGYRFEVNANGVRWEGLFQNVTEIEGNWDGIWQADASRAENGWYSEMRIPFQTIAFNPDSDAWGINFRRAIRRNNESIAWVSRNRQVNPGVAGTMNGLNGMKQGIGLDIVPSLTLRNDRVYGPLGRSEQNYEPQVDVYYKLTPQLNASLTVNTDFSAAEVDSRQVNLTRFNLFFPEQRDFFIRESDIFEFGLIGTGGFNQGGGGGPSGNPAIPSSAAQNARPFFSRKIGLSSRGTPVGIDVGGKISGRIGDWNVGTLVIRQDEDQLTGVDSRDIFVGRAVLNVLAESQLGVITTYGDPQSNLDNTMAGLDFRYRNSKLPGGQTLQGVFFYQQSDSELLQGDDASWGYGIGYPANQGWRGGYNYKRVEKNFNPAVGFVNLTDMDEHSIDFGYRHFYRPGWLLRSSYLGVDGYR
ncbi:MAG: carbohydrate binding family 9 domain-containing protein, partial [Pseudomonadota bacterium]